MKKIYSGFFLNLPIHGKLHATWEFAPGSAELPEEVNEGDGVQIHIVGDYKDEEVECYIVHVELPNGSILTEQPNGTVMHITTYAKEGVSPVQSGLRATENGWTPRGDYRKLVTHFARAGFHRS